MFKPSPETSAIYKALEKLAQGQFISWSELSAQVGFDAGTETTRVRYVRGQLALSGRAVIDAVEGGLRRLTDAEVVTQYAPRQKRRIGRAALRGTTGLSSVDYDSLQATEQVAHNAQLSVFGVIRLCTKKETQAALEEGVRARGATLPPTDALKLFQK